MTSIARATNYTQAGNLADAAIFEYNAVDYDLDGWWDPLAPERLTVPAGVQYAQFTVALPFANDASNYDMLLAIRKNGDRKADGVDTIRMTRRDYNTGSSRNAMYCKSQVYEVVPGDYFDVQCWDAGNTYGYYSSSHEYTSAYFAVEGYLSTAEYMGCLLTVTAGGTAYSFGSDFTSSPKPIVWDNGMQHNTLLSNPAFNIANPTRITIPPGVTSFQLDLGVTPYHSSELEGENDRNYGCEVYLLKNGVDIINPMRTILNGDTTAGYHTRGYFFPFPNIDCVEGDYYEVYTGTYARFDIDNLLGTGTFAQLKFYNNTLANVPIIPKIVLDEAVQSVVMGKSADGVSLQGNNQHIVYGGSTEGPFVQQGKTYIISE